MMCLVHMALLMKWTAPGYNNNTLKLRYEYCLFGTEFCRGVGEAGGRECLCINLIIEIIDVMTAFRSFYTVLAIESDSKLFCLKKIAEFGETPSVNTRKLITVVTPKQVDRSN